MSRQFNIFDVHQAVQKQQHTDEQIDIRQFYPDQIKMTQRVKVDDVIVKLEDLINIYGGKGK